MEVKLPDSTGVTTTSLGLRIVINNNKSPMFQQNTESNVLPCSKTWLLTTNPTLSCVPRGKWKHNLHTKSCTCLLTAASFMTAEMWKQPETEQLMKGETKCAGATLFRIKKEWSNDVCSNVDEPPQNVTPIERIQTPKTTYCVIPYVWNTHKRQIRKTESRLVVAWGWRWEWGFIVNGHKISSWGEESVPTLGYSDGCTTW